MKRVIDYFKTIKMKILFNLIMKIRLFCGDQKFKINI